MVGHLLIQNPTKHLRWSVLQKQLHPLTIFTKTLRLRCLKGFCLRLCRSALPENKALLVSIILNCLELSSCNFLCCIGTTKET